MMSKLSSTRTFSKKGKLLHAYHRPRGLENWVGTESSTSTGVPGHRHAFTAEATRKVMFATFCCGCCLCVRGGSDARTHPNCSSV